MVQPINLLDLTAQHAPLRAEMEEAFRQSLADSAFIQGAAVRQFARELGEYLGGTQVIPCANGTDALQLALMSLGLPAGTEIIMPAFTYVATFEAAAVLGLVPVPIDVLPGTFMLDPQATEAAITSRTGAIVAVHLFGQSADLQALRALADRHALALIEDNAQSLGATFTTSQGEKWVAGTVGEVGTTSFFPSKNLGCLGDGGAMFTSNQDRAKLLYQLANHGQQQKYQHLQIGLNSRLDTLQAAFLRIKLHHLDAWVAARKQIAARYDAVFTEVDGLLPPARDERSTHVFHQYTLQVEDAPRRDALKQHLAARQIASAIYYPQPVHHQPAYQYLGYQPGQFPVAEALSQSVLSIPIHPTLTSEQVTYITDAIVDFFTRK